ncbi:hypothetical protein C8R44DRAFT_77303 [Mycena epipterygia]|nr:hypothetical protein C8R44DRAFT_77303 [Mycena epipterygia]
MGNNESNDRPVSTMSVKNVSRLALENSTRLDVEAPPFHPKIVRSDTTVAEAGSPPSRRSSDEQPFNKRDPDTSIGSSGSANCSFPLSESALPTTFDVSGDLAPTQLSHFFPLPPTKLEAHGSQTTIAASNFPSSASLHQTSMSSLNMSMEHASLQETLDALWAPPKHVPVRISAPVSPIAKTDEPLIDFSDAMPTMPSLLTSSTAPSSSGNTSFEVKSGYQSGNSSALDIDVKADGGEPVGGVRMVREETLTQLVASHPELDLGPLDSSPKQLNDDAVRSNSIYPSRSVSFALGDEDEPLQLPPFTYADAANIAAKYPELATKVLNEPLATPVQTNIMLEPEEEAEHYFTPQTNDISLPLESGEPVPAMPAHTPDRPNWALAPVDSEPEYREFRPRRDRGEYGRRPSSGYQQNQNEFDDAWQYGRGDRSHGDRSHQNSSQHHSGQGRGYDEQEDYNNARNGPNRRGWSQEPSHGANDRNHDLPPHMRANDSHDQSYRLPTRPSETRMDSFSAAARVEESVEPVEPVDGWTPTHDAWAPTAEQPAETRQVPEATVDEWAPKHDAWAAPAEQPAAEGRGVTHSQDLPPSQSFRLPTAPEAAGRDDFHTSAPHRQEGRDAAPANEWGATHDPWAVVGDENDNHGHQSQMLEPTNKREAPSSIRSGGSPFRDRMNDNAHQNDRSMNGEHFSANVLDVRAPSQSNIAALAASHASDNHRGPEKTGGRNQEEELPAEFNYFMHSETVDWTSSGPTKATQNSFSPSQNLATPSQSLATPDRTPTRARSTSISAPAPRSTDYFGCNQQAPSDNFGGDAPCDDRFKIEIPDSDTFVLGSMKTDNYTYADHGYSQRDRSASQWGPSGKDQERQEYRDGGRGRERDTASPGYGRGRRDDYDSGGRRGDDYNGGGRRGDDGGRRVDDYNSGGRRGDDYDIGGRRDDDYSSRGRRGDDYDHGGRRGDDHNSGGRRGDDYDHGGRRGDDHNSGGRRGDDYNSGGRRGDDYDRGGRRGDDYNSGGRRGDDYDSRGGSGNPYASRGKSLPSQAEQMLNSFGGLGPLPPPYSGPPRRTSYGAKNFELPPLDQY